MEEMAELRHEVGDVQDTLETLHRDPNNSAIGMFSSYSHGFFYVCTHWYISAAHVIEHLVKLEAKYGPLPDYSPAIDDVLEYLSEVKNTGALIQ